MNPHLIHRLRMCQGGLALAQKNLNMALTLIPEYANLSDNTEEGDRDRTETAYEDYTAALNKQEHL